MKKTTLPSLPGPSGEFDMLDIAVEEDGALVHINFWDLDQTLLFVDEIHHRAIQKMFPGVPEVDLIETYLSGFRLGNSYREWDRMIRVYREGQGQYRDSETYRKEFVAPLEKRVLIDEPGHHEGFHERAKTYAHRYGVIASQVVHEMFGTTGLGEFPTFINAPVVKLLVTKAKVGEVNIFITANDRVFALALVSAFGLWRYAVGLATDEDMVGGGKEVAIEKTLLDLSQAGYRIPSSRLTIIGDSLIGDLGSGERMHRVFPHLKFSGILVAKDMDDLRLMNEHIRQEGEKGERRSIVENMEVIALSSKETGDISAHFLTNKIGP